MMESVHTRPRGRPHASSRDAIEEVAIGLFLEHGYEQTTIGMITAASGIGRTTLFRYYRSKADIVWSAFSEHTEHLRGLLGASHPGSPTMTAVRVAVVEALAASIDSRGIWMKRFQILDTSAVLRAEESAHWISWADAIAGFVAEDVGLEPAGVVPQAIGGAVQAAFLAVLRGWRDIPDPDGRLLPRLDDDLRGLCDALQAWLAGVGQ
jgi:AcrR family transcriptional regulator